MELNDEQKALIVKIAEKNKFQKFKIQVEQGTNKGDNHMGILTKITIKDEEKRLVLLMKSAESDEAVRKAKSTRNLFLREMYIYEEVFRTFAKFEEEFNVPNRFQMTAKFFGKCNKDKHEHLLLEDKREEGFQMSDKKMTMNSEHLEAVLIEYAKFHSLSLAMNCKNPDRFKKLTKDLKDVFDEGEESIDNLKLFMDALVVNALNAVEGDVIATETLKKYQKDLLDILINIDPEDLRVVTHGDCWCNNFLFKYEDENMENPSKVCIVDWQLSKLGSPALDLCHLLFTNGSREVLNDYKKYLRVYYDEVAENLKHFSCDPDEVFPYDFLEKQFKKYSKHILPICVMMFRMMLCEPDEFPDIAEDLNSGKSIDEMVDFNISNVEEYNRRISCLVWFMIENDLF